MGEGGCVVVTPTFVISVFDWFDSMRERKTVFLHVAAADACFAITFLHFRDVIMWHPFHPHRPTVSLSLSLALSFIHMHTHSRSNTTSTTIGDLIWEVR